LKNVLIPAEPKLNQRRRKPSFDGAPPAPVLLTVFKTRRIEIEQPEDEVHIRPYTLAWMYSSPPVIVPLTYFLRESAWRDPDEEWENLSPPIRKNNPLFLLNRRLIVLGDGPGGGQLGIPTITGGKQRLQIFIAGTEITIPMPQNIPQPLVYGLGDAIGAQPLRIVSQTIGRGQATFDIYDQNASLSIELGQTVLIQEFGIRLFAGCIVTLAPELFMKPIGGHFLIWHVTAVDKSGIFDHRVVLSPFYLAGTDAADVIRDLFSNPAACNPPLAQEGITINNVPASLGGLSTDLVINKQTVTQVINDIMTDVGGVWWIDTTSDLHAVALADIGAAPFSITMTSGGFRKAANVASLVDYRNKEYVVSDRVVEPDNSLPPITGTSITETWTLPQALANSLGYLPLSVVTNFPMLKVTGLKVNGVAQPVYIGTQFPFISFRHTWWYFPQTNNLIPPNIQGLNGFPDPAVTSPDPSPGDVVEISYIAPQQSSGVVTADPLAPAFGTCGSGVYEHVEQVKGITKQSDITAIATALLARSGQVPKMLQFETDQPGLFVGMRLTVDLPPLDLASTTLMITSIDGTALDAVHGLGYGSRFRWQIQATNTQDLGNWINWFERFVARTENAPPLPRLRAYNWDYNGSIPSGNFVGAPATVLDTGLVFEAAVQANNPPVDQDITFDIISAAQGSILGGPQTLTIPAGSTSLITIAKFTNDPAPFYLFENDNLTPVVTYAVNGANPTAAQNVKLVLQVSF
jgi:hypothetical protein